MHLSCEDDNDIYSVLVCGIHIIDVLCGNYLNFSPMPSAYGPRIDLKIKVHVYSVLFCTNVIPMKLYVHNHVIVR